jgi:hypothetical protein
MSDTRRLMPLRETLRALRQASCWSMKRDWPTVRRTNAAPTTAATIMAIISSMRVKPRRVIRCLTG